MKRIYLMLLSAFMLGGLMAQTNVTTTNNKVTKANINSDQKKTTVSSVAGRSTKLDVATDQGNVNTSNKTSEPVYYKDENGNIVTVGNDTPVDFPVWERTGDLKTDAENYRIAKEQYKNEHPE